MENKAFMFMPAWIAPLNALPAEERWNVMNANAATALTSTINRNKNKYKNKYRNKYTTTS